MISRPDRKRLRRLDHDYRMPGPYFITMTLFVREPRFGSVEAGQLVLSDAGYLVTYVWLETPTIFPTVTLDAFVVMPDHMHAILTLGDGTILETAPTLGDVVKRFKGLTTRLYGKGVQAEIYPPYERRLWQERFHDRIIRNRDELDRYRSYIAGNPQRWIDQERARSTPAVEAGRARNTGW